MKKKSKDRLKMDGLIAIARQYPEYFGEGGSESVRTTLKLTEKGVEAKEWLADRWGITQKDVVDTACAYAMVVDRLREEFGPVPESEPVRKTHVLSSGTLKIFELRADELGLSRDELLDQTLILLRAREERADQERLEKHRQAIEILVRAQETLREFEHELEDLLEKDDPVLARFGLCDLNIDNLLTAIATELDGGDPIDPHNITR